jgi:hypothetical protein
MPGVPETRRPWLTEKLGLLVIGAWEKAAPPGTGTGTSPIRHLIMVLSNAVFVGSDHRKTQA